MLLPLWGRRYVEQFIEYGLPTLIAPGNLPAVAQALPCTLTFLTSTEDATILREHPAWNYLASICDVEVVLIDDLITGDNYSTTITLAYARAVRAAGPAMVDTCFFFLISDYLIADGSLANVLSLMQEGASGVLAGNFQVVEEEASKTLYRTFDQGTPEMVLPARKLMAWALDHLHPMTAANMVNFPVCKSSHSNRLFWRVDENTLIGRFYLMHMICIRPEVADFVVGSSCDYSFIPEMCPSGNVVLMTDSDDYLVVEMQPREHERAFLRMGPPKPAQIAVALAEWATARHRKNARSTIVFHAADIPTRLADVVVEADEFINQINDLLPRVPQPHREHPYWIGAISAHRWALRERARETGETVGADEDDVEGSSLRGVMQDIRDFVFGRPPHVRPWHPRWPDYHTVAAKARKLLAGRPNSQAVIVSSNPAMFGSRWLEDAAETTSLDLRRLLMMDRQRYLKYVGSFDLALYVAEEVDLPTIRANLARIWPLIKGGGCLMVVAFNGRGIMYGYGFGTTIAHYSAGFLDLAAQITEASFVRAGRIRWSSLRAMAFLHGGMLRRPALFCPFAAVSSIFLLPGSLIGNLRSVTARATEPPQSVICSSMCLVLRPSRARTYLPDFVLEPVVFTNAERYKNPPRVTEQAKAAKIA